MEMDSLLVISDEPALAETLAGELPETEIEPARPEEAAARLQLKSFRLVVADESAGELPDTGKIPLIRLTRPVRLAELLYTIRARLQGKTLSGREEWPLAEGVVFSSSERLLRVAAQDMPIALTEKETELLQCLLGADGQAVARDTLLKEVWGYSDDIATHTLETHIYRLRGKLRQASESLDILCPVEGGYQLQSAAVP